MKRLVSVLFVLAVLLFPAAAQNSFFDDYVYQMWSSFGGLSGTSATDILQTSDGFINIGTYEGLVRFDGVAFDTVRRNKENGLTFASVRSILQDSNNNLWLGSNDEGLQKLSPDGNLSYTTENGLPNNSVRALAEDRLGNIWIGTASGIVYLTPEGDFITPRFESAENGKAVISRQLFIDSEDTVWFVTESENGLYVFKDGLLKNIPALEDFGPYFTAVTEDYNGNFWIGMGNDGIIRLKNGTATLIHTDTILDYVLTATIYPSADGTVWFGTEKGLAVYSKGAFFAYTGSTLCDAMINKIICDRENNIWVATDRNGVGKLTHGRFRMYKFGVTVNSVSEDLFGRMWFGTDEGLLCFNHDRQEENELTEYTKGIRIRHVTNAKNGDILVSCYRKPGQLRYKLVGGELLSWTTDVGLSGDRTRIAIETSSKDVYVGTTTGLSVIHADGSIRTFEQVDGFENEYIMCLYEDSNGIVWIGTDGGGIYLIKNEKVIGKISTDDGLAGNVVFKISQDSEGVYWICTGNGMTRLPDFDSSTGSLPSVFQSIGSDQGLRSDSVFQILHDGSGTAWLTSNYGIMSVPVQQLVDVAEGKIPQVSMKFHNFNDGLNSEGATSTAMSILDHRGRLWFAMVDGVALYAPSRILEKQVKPLVFINNIKVDNVEIKHPSNEIILAPGTKRVEINFTGLSFDAPDRIKFMHRLSSFEDEYCEPNFARSVSYTNLKPGKHTFQLKVINGDGLESENSETIVFVQNPYIYQMPLFWIFISIIAVRAVFLIFKMKQQVVMREKARLEQLVAQRTQELKKEMEKSDRLLRSILPDKIAAELKDNIHSMGNNYRDVTMFFSDIVSFTKLSSGHTVEEIVFSLNDLFSRFDERAKAMGVEKIKTIGDAYMACCGLPTPRPDHAHVMIDFAKGVLEDLANYNKFANIQFSLRIGLNSGPVNAGVIGKTKFLYDVWGDTVNVASRMESVCTPGGIRVSENVYQHLKDSDVKFSDPIECEVKGKGLMTTYDVLL